MKNLKLLVVLFLFNLNIFAQYTTPGTAVSWTMDDLVSNSSGVITNEGDYYLISQNLTVAATDTIKILQSANIQSALDVEITVEGVLIADPEDGEVLFTAANTTDFYNTIRLENSNASLLRKCIVEYGNGLELVESNILIDSCVIRYNTDDYNSSAIDLYQSNPVIQYCEIYENQSAAIGSGANAGSAPKIYYNEIYSNVISNVNKPQINLGTSENDTIEIKWNTITGEYEMAGGIAIATLAGGNLQCIIDSNVIVNNRYGIAAIGSNIFSIISNNIIDGNNIQNDPMLGGSGINFYGGNTNTSLVYQNVITNNLWGVTIQSSAMPNLGEISTDSTCIGLNEIYDNGNSGEIYALYNNTPSDIYAENNYWGSYNLDTVELNIFHQTDSAALGFVDYMPIAEEPEPPSNIVDVEVNNVKAFPNPCEDYLIFELNDQWWNVNGIDIELFTILGREIKRGVFEGTQKEITMDLRDLVPGMYFVRISNGILAESIKITKL